MANLEEMSVHERATIEFPRAIDSDETWELLKKIRDNHNVRIHGGFEGFYSLLSADEKRAYQRQDVAGCEDYKREAKISGLMSRTDPFVNSGFVLSQGHNDDFGKYIILQFDTAGCDDYFDLGSRCDEIVNFWDEIRKAIPNYIH